jgi:RNA polymerase sigma-70 factor (ECF subfamily)
VQDALIKVHRALPRFQDGNFRSWLLRIVTNTCYDYLRSQRRRAAISLDDLTEPSTAITESRNACHPAGEPAIPPPLH